MASRRPGDYVSATAAAHRLGVPARTLRRYAQDGRLPDVRGAGRLCRLLRAVVTAGARGGDAV